MAKKFGLSASKGALVAQVVKDSPADKAGLKRGDVLLSYRGNAIPDSSTLRNEVAGTPRGQEAKVTVWREGKEQSFTVKIGSLEDATRMLAASVRERLGVVVRPVTEKETQKYQLDPQEGVAISSVDPKGPLGEAGFEVNDIILEINNASVEGVEGFVDMVNALPHNQRIVIKALDHRTGDTGYLEVNIR
jgi:serine protease Do